MAKSLLAGRGGGSGGGGGPLQQQQQQQGPGSGGSSGTADGGAGGGAYYHSDPDAAERGGLLLARNDSDADGAAAGAGGNNNNGNGSNGAGGALSLSSCCAQPLDPSSSSAIPPSADSFAPPDIRRQLLECPEIAASGRWSQLCATCRIVRPLRAKHCAVTGRCVEVFDHYCPWVGNAVGKGNRGLFLAFLLLESYALAAATGVSGAALRAHLEDGAWASDVAWTTAFVVASAFVGLSVWVLAAAQASQVARNVTTNELANWHRYPYLVGAGGNFRNPFSRGWRDNCAEAFAPRRTPVAPLWLSPSSSLAAQRQQQ